MTLFDEFEMRANNIWFFRGVNCALGCVGFIHHGTQVVLVRKATVAGYEFSGKWSLPGGIVRGAHVDGIWGALRNSLRHRVRLETGLILPFVDIASGDWGTHRPITRYTVKGEVKYTAVIPALCAPDSLADLVANDHSVDEARWVEVEDLHNFDLAPANRIIVHNLVQEKFGQQVAGPPPIDAQNTCRENLNYLKKSASSEVSLQKDA